MNKTLILKIVFGIAIIIFVWVVWHFVSFKNSPGPVVPDIKNTETSLEYKNTEYRFSLSLPISWKGYSVTVDKWTGYAINDELGDTAFTDGPVVSIHNPKWTAAVPYQDIPIMVFTLDQWIDLQKEKFHIGATPIGPSELGRNPRYVFALPARYNFAFPPGYEEVDRIIQSNPLRAY
ncbi:hypothetical protein HY967_04265 [Candidatus Jorgensenbacteria bacterium]|nr:hypothetical protein [Candidatus Jorgensenbacteria bacterium]